MNKEILRLALPNILSNISVPLLSSVDVALMGGLSVAHLGALGLATMIFNFVFWNFGFLRMGTTGAVAQAYGADDRSRTEQVLSMSILLALALAGGLILCQSFLLSVSGAALGAGEEHLPLVAEYFGIRIWSAPATLLIYTMLGWLFGMQDAVKPMIATILINIVNIATSYYMVKVLGWGIKGVALGTVLAEYVGVMFLGWIVYGRYRAKMVSWSKLNGWSQFFKVNGDLFFRTVALTSAFAFFYRQSSLAGGLILAANVVLLQFLSWMSYAIDGFAYASESLVGKYFGAKDQVSLTKAIRLSFTWAAVSAVGFGIVFYFGVIPISSIFTQEVLVLEVIEPYAIYLFVLPLIAFWCYMWDGVFIGLTKTTEMRNTMLLSLLIYVGCFYLVREHLTNAIWLAFLLFLGSRGLLLTFSWFSVRNKLSEQ